MNIWYIHIRLFQNLIVHKSVKSDYLRSHQTRSPEYKTENQVPSPGVRLSDWRGGILEMAFWFPLIVLGLAYAVCRFLLMLIPPNIASIEVDASDGTDRDCISRVSIFRLFLLPVCVYILWLVGWLLVESFVCWFLQWWMTGIRPKKTATFMWDLLLVSLVGLWLWFFSNLVRFFI